MSRTIVALLTLTIVMPFSVPTLAGDEPSSAPAKSAAQAAKEQVNLEGTIVCLGCSLKKSEGARAQCDVYGHTHALLTTDGKYISFLPNKYSATLIEGKEFHSKKAMIHGIYFPAANLIDVETYEVDGKKYGWCEGHGMMDSCSFAQGDTIACVSGRRRARLAGADARKRPTARGSRAGVGPAPRRTPPYRRA